jgi:serine/threonine protein phosphatase 1
MRASSTAHPPFDAASLPPQTRIYAVGDIHGRSDLLTEVLARIDEDLERRPIEFPMEVYLGDYIDRGADSKTVIDMLAVRLVRNRAICLRGNHEALMEAFLEDPSGLRPWLPVGASQTLASYGIRPPFQVEAAVELRQALIDALPRTHELFFRCLHNSFSCGDFLFVHAGVRPNIPISEQDPHDLMWIRGEFLNWTQHHGKFIVHGHTPVPHPDIRNNRINIDTGAWRTGVLTCVAIEGKTMLML